MSKFNLKNVAVLKKHGVFLCKSYVPAKNKQKTKTIRNNPKRKGRIYD